MEFVLVVILGLIAGVTGYWVIRVLRRREAKRHFEQEQERDQLAMKAFQKAFTVQASVDRAGMSSWEIAWHEHCESIERAVNRGDFDTARRMLQKISYGMVDRKNVTDAQRAEFTRYMADFAKLDPLYKQILAEVQSILAKKNGSLQSELFKKLSHHDVEMLRYTTYFAHELGDLMRKKKGRSYALYLPGTILDASTLDGAGKNDSGASLTVTISVTDPSEKERKARELLKQATANSEDDWYVAIDCLREAYRLLEYTGSYPIETYCRLPLYLQRAGRYKEALAEFDALLARIPTMVADLFTQSTPEEMQRVMDAMSNIVRDKMRIAREREERLNGPVKQKSGDAKVDEVAGSVAVAGVSSPTPVKSP